MTPTNKILALLLCALLLPSCSGTMQIFGPGFDDDDVIPADDDDLTPADDDDLTPADDDDLTPADDDDLTPADDDDDTIGDDDDDTAPTTFPCADEVLQCGDVIHATTVGRGDDRDWYACTDGGITGPDIFYEFIPPTSGLVSVEMSPQDADLDLVILRGDDCDPTACEVASFAGGASVEEAGFLATAGSRWIVVVDGWQGAAAPFTLSVLCDVVDGIDADGDGWGADGDCDDSDPTRFPGATELCDGVDNDCDAAVDEAIACGSCYEAVHDGHDYLFCHENPAEWPAAESYCDHQGYYLSTVDDQVENEFLAGQVMGSIVGPWWIGLNDRGQGNEGSFSWSGPPNTGFESWAAGEPNNASNAEDCVTIAQWANHEWNDDRCNSAKPFICEAGF